MKADTQIMQAVSEQYAAALKMLEDTVTKCDAALWQDSTTETVISQVIYHTMFFVDFYLSKNKAERESFKGKYGDDGGSFHEPDRLFTKEQLTTYVQEIKEKANELFSELTIDDLNKQPVFEWHGSSELSSLLYNLRHIMLHVGALHVRINAVGNNMPLRWVSKIPEEENAEMNETGVWHLQQGNLTEAEKIFVTLTAGSKNATFYYNLACCYALQKKLDQSLETLQTCFHYDQSGRFKQYAKTDKDFTNIRELDAFKQLLPN